MGLGDNENTVVSNHCSRREQRAGSSACVAPGQFARGAIPPGFLARAVALVIPIFHFMARKKKF